MKAIILQQNWHFEHQKLPVNPLQEKNIETIYFKEL